MPTETQKLKIKKPLGNETVTRQSFNENWDQIDKMAVLEPFLLADPSYDAANDRIVCTLGKGIAELFNGDTRVIVEQSIDATYYINTPAINTTYYIFLGADGNYTHNTTGTVPAGAMLLWQVATGASVSTLTKTDRRAQISGAGAKLIAHLADTAPHNATSAATASRLMLRDADGRAKVAAPSAVDDIARKDTVDAVQANLNTHLADLITGANGAHGLKVETGSFTPRFGGYTSDGTISHSIQVGEYTKIGKLVFINITLMCSGVSVAASGNLVVKGLPFATKNQANRRHAVSIHQYEYLPLDNTKQLMGGIFTNASEIYLAMSDNNYIATNVNAAGVMPSSFIIISGFYETN